MLKTTKTSWPIRIFVAAAVLFTICMMGVPATATPLASNYFTANDYSANLEIVVQTDPPVETVPGGIESRETRGTNVSDALSREVVAPRSNVRVSVGGSAGLDLRASGGVELDARVQDIGEQFIGYGGVNAGVTNKFIAVPRTGFTDDMVYIQFDVLTQGLLFADLYDKNNQAGFYGGSGVSAGVELIVPGWCYGCLGDYYFEDGVRLGDPQHGVSDRYRFAGYIPVGYPVTINAGLSILTSLRATLSATGFASGMAGSYFQNSLRFEVSSPDPVDFVWASDLFFDRQPSLSDQIPGPFALTVTKQGAGSGIITSVPEGIGCGKTCGASFPENTTVTLAAVPEAGSLFAGWTGCDSVAGEQCLVTMSAPRTVTAMFTSAPLTTLTVRKEGAGIGTVRSVPGGIICGDECSNTYDPGTSVTLSATPEPGYAFMGWSGGGCSGKEDCTVTLWDSMVVSARFDCSLPLPTRQEVFAYDAVRVPKMVCNASDLKPIGVGLAADGKPWFSLAVNMPGFEEKVDYYLAFYAPDIDAQNVYLMRPDGSLAPLKGGLTLWMEGVESPVMNMPWAEMGYFFGINVPLGQYHAALLVTPQGALMGPYYVWITSFRVK